MAPEVLAEGRLHPATLLFQLGKGLRGLWLFFAVAAYRLATGDAVDRVTMGMLLVLMVVVALLFPLLHWARYRFRLTAEALEIESGVLRRTVRRIPVSRIQDLGTKAGVLHRALGVVTVVVETSGAAQAEAELDVLGRQGADRLVEALRAARGGAPAPPTQAARAPLLRVSVGELVLRGLTDNRAGLLVLTALTMLERVGDVGEVARDGLAWAEARVLPTLGSGPSLAVAVAFALATVWLLGYFAAVVFNVLTFAGFELSIDRGVAERTFGLFTRQRRATPLHRIQALRLRQSPVRSLLGLASLEAHDMGASGRQEAQRTGTDTFVPIASEGALRALVPLLVPGAAAGSAALRPVSPRMVRRGATAGLVLGLLAAAAAAIAAPSTWALWLAAPIVGAALAGLLARRAFHRLRVGTSGPHLFVHRGLFGREEVLVPAARIQAVEIARGPLDRYHGVASLRVVVGGGAQVTVGNLPVAEARQLRDELIAAADPLAQAPAC